MGISLTLDCTTWWGHQLEEGSKQGAIFWPVPLVAGRRHCSLFPSKLLLPSLFVMKSPVHIVWWSFLCSKFFLRVRTVALCIREEKQSKRLVKLMQALCFQLGRQPWLQGPLYTSMRQSYDNCFIHITLNKLYTHATKVWTYWCPSPVFCPNVSMQTATSGKLALWDRLPPFPRNALAFHYIFSADLSVFHPFRFGANQKPNH